MGIRFALFLFIVLAATPALADLWFEGGTLQKATLEQWQKATPANQLATAGDFVASLNAITDLSAIKDHERVEHLRKQAEELVACVNDTAKQESAPLSQPVAETVVVCAVLKPRQQ